MQTRIFEKTPREVYNAVNSLCQDMTLQPMGRFSQGGLTCLSVGAPKFKQSWSGKIKVEPGQIFQIKFSCEHPCQPDVDEKTVVRSRIQYHAEQIGQHEQSVNPSDYSKIFDQIGQYLFIEAIEWSPDVQQ